MTETLLIGIILFTLATFLGLELINRVPPTLHTPLMSGANAVSGITVIGALLVAGAGHDTLGAVLGFIAIVFAMINVVGGYAVTDRMLGMFRKKDEGR
ncbi:MAG TPA: NAD(P) transhydrogenase subunit alpha [Polyangiaceae bacterium]|jgi:NAD(P) transhydrogenase subunit alpha|nr:NAD(P) transhydrogenase subunit alpha [Polyangiaceae bacterium]